jgi:hypothetical protein
MSAPVPTIPGTDRHTTGAVRTFLRAAPVIRNIKPLCDNDSRNDGCQMMKLQSFSSVATPTGLNSCETPEPHGCQGFRHPSCPRCHAPMLSLGDLAAIALDALSAYRRMKLAIPDAMRVGLTTLASVLPCHAGTCTPASAPAHGKGSLQITP